MAYAFAIALLVLAAVAGLVAGWVDRPKWLTAPRAWGLFILFLSLAAAVATWQIQHEARSHAANPANPLSSAPVVSSATSSTLTTTPASSGTKPAPSVTSTGVGGGGGGGSGGDRGEGWGGQSKPSSTDVIRNMHLGVSPSEISRSEETTVTISVWDAEPDSIVDMEVASPPEVQGGICPEIREGSCNLIYSGGCSTDASGSCTAEFTWYPSVGPAGTYLITVRDRRSGVILDLALEVL